MEADVLSRWRHRSMAAGWSLAEDWWTPEVEVVLKAVRGTCDLPQACWALGAARAGAGVGVAEGMNDLAALFAVTGAGGPPFAALRSFATGWAEHGFAPLGELHCEDPLTGLVTAAYLRTRLAQLYRGTARGTCLVAAEPPDPPRTWQNASPPLSTWPPRCGGPSQGTRRWRCWGPCGWGP
ncbi:hypothetical protein ACFQQB_25695 [Nonomuraea rubra]|uniref:hypothetical protein n=1 Tax=Nonomuraea rubra TaxID=46180 RepID=UPI00361A4B53